MVFPFWAREVYCFFCVCFLVQSWDCKMYVFIYILYIRSVDLISWLWYFFLKLENDICVSEVELMDLIVETVASVTSDTSQIISDVLWFPTRLKRLCVLHAMFKQTSCFQSVVVGWFTSWLFLVWCLRHSIPKRLHSCISCVRNKHCQ